MHVDNLLLVSGQSLHKEGDNPTWLILEVDSLTHRLGGKMTEKASL